MIWFAFPHGRLFNSSQINNEGWGGSGIRSILSNTRVQLLLVWYFTLFLSFLLKNLLTHTHTCTHRYPPLRFSFIHPDAPSHTTPLSKVPKFNYCQGAAGDTAAEVQLKEILTRNTSSKYIMKEALPQTEPGWAEGVFVLIRREQQNKTQQTVCASGKRFFNCWENVKGWERKGEGTWS